MKVNTNISLDAELKKNAVSLFKEFGLDLSTAISLFLSQAVREQKIPFEIKRDVSSKPATEKTKKSKTKKTSSAGSNTFTEDPESSSDTSSTIRSILEPDTIDSKPFADDSDSDENVDYSSVDALLDDFFK